MTASNCPKPAAGPSEKEKAQIEELRVLLDEKLPGGIPADLDTDLNLVRWIRGHQGDLEQITKHFQSYINSRKAAGFEGADFPEKFFDMEGIQEYLPFIASSRLQDEQWLEESNSFLFVERAWSQPKEFIKTMKTSDYLLHCFGYSEMLLQLILRREALQDPSKGPVQFIVVFDLATINITDYLNPMSGYMKMWQLRSTLWQDWFPDMVQRIFLVNPPRALSLLWKLARVFLNERNCQLIEIIGDKKDFADKHLPRWFVPKEYGGDFVSKLPYADETGVSIRKKITSQDYYQPFQHYHRSKIERPKSAKKDIAPSERFAVPIAIPENGSLLWDFTVSGDVDFSICRNKDPNDMLFPKLHLVSSKLPEEGQLQKLPQGEYSLLFNNRSGYFTVKLEYCIAVVSRS
ncbi:unnamed protein product, partial [Mesorhabditis spiculigera]